MSEQRSDQERSHTCSEELYSSMLLLQDIRKDVRGVLAVVDIEISRIKESGHLPSAALLERLGYNTEAHRGHLEIAEKALGKRGEA